MSPALAGGFSTTVLPGKPALFDLNCMEIDFYLLGFFCVVLFSLAHQGSNLSPLQWQPGALTTGPPGRALISLFEYLTKLLLKHFQAVSDEPHKRLVSSVLP